jgi:hypothetical protein
MICMKKYHTPAVHKMTKEQMYNYAKVILHAHKDDSHADVIERYLKHSEAMWARVRKDVDLGDMPCRWRWCKESKVYIFE